MIFKGYIDDNNKFLASKDANKPALYIIHFDANSLDGHSVMQLLPTSDLIELIQKILI